MSRSTSPRIDPVDIGIVVVIAAVGAVVVQRVVPELDDRWFLPAAVALVVGLVVALAAPRPRPTSEARPSAVVGLSDPPVAAAAPTRPPASAAAPTIQAPTPPARAPLRIDPDATHVRVRRVPVHFTNDRFVVRSLSLPKLGNEDGENEDGWFVTTDVRRLSVADGASSAFASRQWSKLLTESFAAERMLDLSDAQQRVDFVATCAARWDAATSGGGDWWSNDARAKGSFAAFVGVVLADDLSFVADAVGDSCLMAVDESGRLRMSFPLTSAEQFDSTPSLLGTNEPEAGEWRRAAGRLAPGHSLVLATDAVAEWLLGDAAQRLPWLVQADETVWTEALVGLRERNEMVNDDVTIVVATCRGA